MLLDLVTKNRSYRGFDHSIPMQESDLLDMINCARLTASSVNMQPFLYYAAWKEEDLQAIFPETKWARQLPELQLPFPGQEPTGYIVIFQDTRINQNLSRFQKDCGIVAQTILLRATEMGFGGCMICNFSAEGIRKALGQPEDLAPLMVIALGKPVETIELTNLEPGADSKYYRDEQNVHYVPKRRLADIVLPQKQP